MLWTRVDCLDLVHSTCVAVRFRDLEPPAQLSGLRARSGDPRPRRTLSKPQPKLKALLPCPFAFSLSQSPSMPHAASRGART